MTYNALKESMYLENKNMKTFQSESSKMYGTVSFNKKS